MAYQYNLPSLPTLGGRRRTKSSIPAPGKGGNAYTPLQLFQLRMAEEMAAKKADQGYGIDDFFGDVWHGAKVGYHFLTKPLSGVAEGVKQWSDAAVKRGGGTGFVLDDLAMTIGSFGKGFAEGITNENNTTFSNVIQNAYPEWSEKHPILTALAALPADIAGDPLNALTLAPKLALGSRRFADLAFTPLKSAEQYSSAFTTLKALPGFERRADYVKFKGDTFGKVLTKPEQQMRDALRTEAIIEAGKQTKYASIGVKVGGATLSTPTHLGRVRIAPKTPNLLRAAAGGSKVFGKVPGFTKTAAGLAKTFKTEQRLLHGHAITARHAAELYFKTDRDKFQTIIKPFSELTKNNNKGMKEALRIFSKPGAVSDGQIVMGFLKHHGLSDLQIDFIKAWHQYFDDIYESEQLFKVRAGKFDYIKVGVNTYRKNGTLQLGRGYVPIMFDRKGLRIMYDPRKSSIAAQPGFTKPAKDLRYDELLDLAERGALKSDEIELDPIKLAMMRTRKSAYARSNQLLADTLTRLYGIPVRVEDTKRIDKLTKKLDSLNQDLALAWRDYNVERLGKATQFQQVGKEIRELEEQRDGIKAGLDSLLPGTPEHKQWQQLLKDTETALANVKKKLPTQTSSTNRGKVTTTKILPDITKRIDKLQSEIDYIEKNWSQLIMKKNPVIKKMMAKDVKLVSIGKNVPDFVFPEEIARGASIVIDTLVNDESLAQFNRIFQKMMHNWKIIVTSFNLTGYNARNTISDMINGMIEGFDIASQPIYLAKAGKWLREVKTASGIAEKGGKLSAKQEKVLAELFEMNNQGILSGLFPGDIQQLSNLMRYGGSKISLVKGIRGPVTAVKNPIKLYLKITQDVSRNRENMMRIAHYKYRLEVLKEPSEEAAWHVRRAHFDYEDLTPIEQRKFKAVFPFYTWLRKNIPFQLQALLQNPAMATVPYKIGQEFESNVETEGDLLPEFLQKSLGAFKVPGDAYTNIAFPTNDLRLLLDPRQLISNAGPHITIPLSVATGRNFFLGTDISSDGRYEPINEYVAKPFSFIPGATKKTSREIDGKLIESEGANPWLRYALGLTPITNYLAGKNPINDARRGGSGFSDLSYWGGIPVYRYSQEDLLNSEVAQFNEKMQNLIRQYRDSGLLPQSEERDRTDFENRIRDLIAQSRGR